MTVSKAAKGLQAVKEVAIYMEGGGDTVQQKAELRQGVDALLKATKAKVQQRQFGWKLICCGSRNEAYSAFMNAVKVNPQAINVLLVDAEDPINALTGDKLVDAKIAVAHLMQRDPWHELKTVPAQQVHLMVQCMEAWIVADPDALEKFYGQYFGRNKMPTRQNLEEEAKSDIYAKLEQATNDRKIGKGSYGKIKHASKLLAMIDPAKVANRCLRFVLLNAWLDEVTVAK